MNSNIPCTLATLLLTVPRLSNIQTMPGCIPKQQQMSKQRLISKSINGTLFREVQQYSTCGIHVFRAWIISHNGRLQRIHITTSRCIPALASTLRILLTGAVRRILQWRIERQCRVFHRHLGGERGWRFGVKKRGIPGTSPLRRRACIVTTPSIHSLSTTWIPQSLVPNGKSILKP